MYTAHERQFRLLRDETIVQVRIGRCQLMKRVCYFCRTVTITRNEREPLLEVAVDGEKCQVKENLVIQTLPEAFELFVSTSPLLQIGASANLM